MSNRVNESKLFSLISGSPLKLLTGVATLRAGVFPPAAGILLLAATAGFFFAFFVAEFLPPVAGQVGIAALGILLGLGFTWIGISMWMRT